MKQRINISIEYETIEKAKTHINNISAYLESCLVKANAEYDYKQKQKLRDSAIMNGYTDSDSEVQELDKKMEELYNIVNTKWLER